MQYNLSYWERRSFFEGIDVAVIGSGIVGLSAAIHLRLLYPNKRIVVLERGTLPVGASTRNAGFACFGSMTELLDDVSIMLEVDVLAIVEKRWRGLRNLRQLIGDEPLDFKMHGGYEMFTDEENSIFQSCTDQIPDWNEKMKAITGVQDVYQVVDEQLGRFGFAKHVKHLIHNTAEGQVHTGKMMQALLQLARERGVEIFNGFLIQHIEDDGSGVRIETAMGWQIHVPQVLVCTNGFAASLLPNLAVYPARNQVLITQPVPHLKVEGCFHYDRGYFYFRNIDGRILLGGGRNLDPEKEKTYTFEANERIRTALLELLQKTICPDQPIEIDSWWTGILGLGPVKKPIVERVSPHIAVAVRMSGMGVAIGTLVGQEGATLIPS